jgi:hypothetical protein
MKKDRPRLWERVRNEPLRMARVIVQQGLEHYDSSKANETNFLRRRLR